MWLLNHYQQARMDKRPPCVYAGAQEVVMLDREALALQCALLSAQACGLDSVEAPTLHPSPFADAGQQGQQSDRQGQPQCNDGSTATAQPQVITVIAEH